MACCVNPVQGHEQDRVDRHAAARRRSAHRRRRGPASGELPAGEVGEMILRAPQHMAEYWNNPLETAETLRTHGPGGPWLHTGDLAYMDEDGYIFLVDRKKDMIKTSGFQVWPREIEEVLAAHPAVHGGRRRRRARRRQGRSGQGVGRAASRASRRPKTSCAPTAASGWRPTRCRRSVEFRTSCRRRWSARCCGACCSRRPKRASCAVSDGR